MSSFETPSSQSTGAGVYRWPIFAAILLAAVLVWRFGGFSSPRPLHDPNVAPRPTVLRGDLMDDEKRTIQIFEQASPSVVFITRVVEARRSAFDWSATEFVEGTGSGFIWDETGNIVTNYHVIEGASKWKVTLANKKSYWGRRVGGWRSKDLAVLKIDAPADQLKPIRPGVSKSLRVGQKVYAIGNPFGLDQTLTTGIISALNRQIASPSGVPIEDAIQTDAAINKGNSGGPLLDSEGLLIGVNTAIVSPSGTSAGIGFAIPVDTVNDVVTELIKHGEVVRPGLGITFREDVNELVARESGVAGVAILNLSPNSPLREHGIEIARMHLLEDDTPATVAPGDLIVGLDGRKVTNGADLQKALVKRKVADEVELEVYRSRQRRTFKIRVKLVALPL